MDKPSYTVAIDGARVVTLNPPVEGHDGMIAEVRIRPPRYSDFMALGDPTVLIVSANAMVPQDDLVTIRRYIETLADSKVVAHLDRCSLHDAMALRDAVKSFFSAKSANT